MEYILSEKETCFLCLPEQELVLWEGKKCFIIANAFPYNPGHLMVAPYRHVGDLDELTDSELQELTQLSVASIRALKKWANPHGFNLGMNLGKAAGAGEFHLHQHVVPRWDGDTNYMPVLADVKVIPQHLSEICGGLRKEMKKMKIKAP
jgi:ATP adenylyltransferase